jgi:hypothetical protein
VSIYEAGFNPRPEDEREQESWHDSDDGDMPWAPNPVEAPLPWKPHNWTGTPEEQMHRDKLDDDFDITNIPPTGSIEESVKDDAQWERDDEPFEEDEDA